jgi:hypothetical protein
VWVSRDGVNGSQAATIETAIGQPVRLYLWVSAAGGEGFDVTSVYCPLAFLGPTGGLEVGQPGSGAWNGSTDAPAGTPPDTSYAVLPPVLGWTLTCLFDPPRDTTTMIGAFEFLCGGGGAAAAGKLPSIATTVTSWSGRAPIAAFTVMGSAEGDYALGDTGLPLADGSRRFIQLSNSSGSHAWAPVVAPLTIHVGTPAGVHDAAAPVAFALEGLYPSPARTRTSLAIAAPEVANVRLALFDIAGRQVAGASRAFHVDPGRRHETMDTSRLAAGVYVCRVTMRGMASGATHEFTRRFIVVR